MAIPTRKTWQYSFLPTNEPFGTGSWPEYDGNLFVGTPVVGDMFIINAVFWVPSGATPTIAINGASGDETGTWDSSTVFTDGNFYAVSYWKLVTPAMVSWAAVDFTIAGLTDNLDGGRLYVSVWENCTDVAEAFAQTSDGTIHTVPAVTHAEPYTLYTTYFGESISDPDGPEFSYVGADATNPYLNSTSFDNFPSIIYYTSTWLTNDYPSGGAGGGAVATSSLAQTAMINGLFLLGTAPPADLTVNFDASASTGSEPLTLDWDFGDGATDVGVAPSHTYASTGTYTVILTVTDAIGRVDTETQDVTLG